MSAAATRPCALCTAGIPCFDAEGRPVAGGCAFRGEDIPDSVLYPYGKRKRLMTVCDRCKDMVLKFIREGW